MVLYIIMFYIKSQMRFFMDFSNFSFDALVKMTWGLNAMCSWQATSAGLIQIWVTWEKITLYNIYYSYHI